MALFSYDPDQVTIVFKGIPIVHGFGPDTFINAERNEDSWLLTVGANGEAIRTRNHNRSGKVTITLLQSSDANTALSKALTDDEASQLTNPGLGTLLIQDLSGQTLLRGDTAWISKPATVELAKDATTREWVFETDNLVMQIAGLAVAVPVAATAP